MLVDVALTRARILRAQTRRERSQPDGQLRHQRTSRLAAAADFYRGAHPGDHAGDLRIPPRAGNGRPAVHGQGHACGCQVRRRAPRWRCWRPTAVETIIQHDDGFTPTPVISHAILIYNRGRKQHLADGIVITPSHNPPEDGGFKYNPTNGGPADTDVTGWMEDRANEFLRNEQRDVKRVPYRSGDEGGDHSRAGLRDALCQRPGKCR